MGKELIARAIPEVTTHLLLRQTVAGMLAFSASPLFPSAGGLPDKNFAEIASHGQSQFLLFPTYDWGVVQREGELLIPHDPSLEAPYDFARCHTLFVHDDEINPDNALRKLNQSLESALNRILSSVQTARVQS